MSRAGRGYVTVKLCRLVSHVVRGYVTYSLLVLDKGRIGNDLFGLARRYQGALVTPRSLQESLAEAPKTSAALLERLEGRLHTAFDRAAF